MTNLYSHLVTVTFTILVCIGIFLLMVNPFSDPLVYSVLPFNVDKKVYTTKEHMVVISYRCNYEGKPLVVSTKELYFYNLSTGERYYMPSSTGTVQAGCSWQEARSVGGWHPEMPSGFYVKKGITEAKGRWRTVEVPWITEQFEYVKT